jgi:hypothetical protein
MSRRFHLFLSVIVALTVIFSLWEARAVKLAVPPRQVLLQVALPLVPLGFAFYYRWRREEKLKNLFVVTFWAIVLDCVYGLPVYIAARQNVVLRDALLADMDRRLGLEVPDILRFMEHYPEVKHALDICYECLLPLIVLALALPVLCNKPASVAEFFIACVVSIVILIPLFAAFQAVGPWHYYGYAPNAEQERTTRVFFALKSDEWLALDSSNSAGVVAFPSFHTILAVLSAIAFWRIPYVRWLAALLACLIVVSTLTTGWHYVADVLAGLAIAAVSMAAARGFTWLDTKWGGTPTEADSVHQLPNTKR